MDTKRYRRAVDTTLSKTRQGIFDHIDRGLSDIRAELIYLNAGQSPGDLNQRTLVARMIEGRQQRTRYFSADLFAEPAWDIILTLALARIDGRRVALKEAVLGSAVPQTTAVRWLSVLEQRDVVERAPDPADGRRVFVGLTDDAWDSFATWLEVAAA